MAFTARPAALLAWLFCLAGNAQAAELIDQPRLSASTQRALAAAALDACAAKGAQVSVAVARPDGVVSTVLSADGASRLAIESAARKSVSAALIGYPTGRLPDAEAKAPAYVALLRSVEPRLATIGGGLPVRRQGRLVGAIGVGGAAGPEADEACASTAITAVLGRDVE